MKFLLVEDDEALAGAIEKLLAEHQYIMDLATDGIVGRDMAGAFPYDLILLDWTLPKLDGIQLCKHLRNEGNYTPIILLAARDNSADKVAGLEAGADDYLVKPFEFEELLARIHALLRRAEGIVSPVLQWGDLYLDPRSGEVTCRSLPVAVTPKEYALLELFLRNPNRIFSSDNLLDKVWPFNDSPGIGSIRTHIKGLRQKLKKVGLPDIIATVYGLGYRLKSSEFVKADQVSQTEGEPDGDTDQTLAAARKPSHSSVGKPDGVGELDLASLWQGVSESYIQQVVSLSNTVRGLHLGLVDQADRQQILTEAHSLAGALGSFGFREVTAQCREIENILCSNAYLSAQHLLQLEALIAQSQQTLEQGYLVSKTAAIAPLQANDSPPLTSTVPAPLSPSLEAAIAAAAPLPGQLFQLLLVNVKDKSSKGLTNEREENWWQSLKAIAAQHGMQVSAVDSVAEARSAILAEETEISQRPHIVVFDFKGSYSLPANSSPELELLAELQAMQPPIPTLVLAVAARLENRVRVARLGVAGLLQMPVEPTEVLETATQVLQKGAPPTAKLLVVDDDPAMLTLLQSLLQPWGFRIELLSEPQRFWQTLERFVPDLVLLDVKMPEISGFDLCQVLRNAPRWQETPVLLMSGYTDAETIQQVFSAGADDYIRKPIVAPELIAGVLGWLERSRTRRLLANVDSLTGVANRRKSTQLLTQLMGLAQRQGQTLCFALIDFDNFKQVNDEYGHPVGDRVLRRFGESLRSTFRAEDVVGRWGGEEFVVGLYGMSRQEGTERLQELLESWRQEQFSPIDSSLADAPEDTEETRDLKKPTFQMTFTAGVAVYPHDGTDLQQLYRAADKALYRAKSAGRDRVLSSTVALS